MKKQESISVHDILHVECAGFLICIVFFFSFFYFFYIFFFLYKVEF